ncbi:2-keto-4-pentenoate hydratase [Caulobacter sp. ErkDOM-YI]|uniref:2-keto-4-pentenoate hydratase n=1 Tax=unclassified Caulobacter TaxID=2648921 RepID=UPI003AF543BD
MTVASEALAARLRDAYRTGAVPPLRDGLEPTDFKKAYEVQALNTTLWTGQGRKIVGRKIGLTSKAVQVQLGVDQPDYGVLFDDMAIANGGVLLTSRALQPKAEAEVALVLARDLDNPDAQIADIVAATDYASTAIEIVDSRIADWRITFADTVADNGSSAFFVLGNERRKLDGLDLYTCGMALEVNGQLASLGAGAACLGHPLNAAAWLARTLAAVGEPLKAGDILLTGALGPMVALTPGDRVEAMIGGLGRASFSFEKDRP